MPFGENGDGRGKTKSMRLVRAHKRSAEPRPCRFCFWGARGSPLGFPIAKGLGAVAKGAKNMIKSAAKPERVAAEKVQAALKADVDNIILQQGDEAIAKINDQPFMNVDRGGETTRALARAASKLCDELNVYSR